MVDNLVGHKVPECVGDISILLIDNDTKSVLSLTSMLEQFSYKVISVNVASEAVSMIEKEENIKLVITNTEMHEIDSPSFVTALLEKGIPLTLITPEIETKKASDMLTKGACFSLKKPISEMDIQNLIQHVLIPKKSQEYVEEIKETESQERVVDAATNQIEAFKEILKRQGTTGQASLLRRRKETFTTSQKYPKRRSIANVEWKTKPVLRPIETEKKKVESSFGRRCNLWNHERHMKFLAALSILDDKNCRPKAILKIMNDPNLNHRQVSSHLQKYKAQVDRINDALPKNEWKSSTNKTFQYPPEYEYPFKASNLKKFLISSNSFLYSLRKKNSTSLSTVQYAFEKPADERNTVMPKFHLGGKLDSSNHSLFGNVQKNPSMTCVPAATSNNPPYNFPSSNDINHTGLVSKGLSSDNLHVFSGLPSSLDASDAFHMGSSIAPMPQSIPNPFLGKDLDPIPMSSVYVQQSDIFTMGESSNALPHTFLGINLDPIPIPNIYVPQSDLFTMGESSNVLPSYTMNPLENNMNQLMDWIPSTENVFVPETNMNIVAPQTNTTHMDWVSSREGYVPPSNLIPFETNINQMGRNSFGKNYVLPQDMIFHKTNRTHVGSVSREMSYQIPPKTNMNIFETNINQMERISSQESYVLPETNATQVCLHTFETSYAARNIVIAHGTVVTQVGLHTFETSYAAQNTVIAHGTNVEEMGLVPCEEEGYEFPIEDLISFKTGVNETSMEKCDSSEENFHFSTSYLNHNLGSTSQTQNMMESCKNQNVEVMNQEGNERGVTFNDDLDCMEWIDQILNKDA